MNHETYPESINPENYQMEAGRWSAGRNALMFVALVSLALCVFGYIENPERFFRSWLVAFAFVAGIGLGAFFFIAVQHLAGSAASVTVRRIQENIMVTLPVCALLFLPLAFGLKYVYPWSHPEVVAASKEIQAKGAYLSETWFVLRTYGYFLLWSIWVFSMYWQSTKQDKTRSIRQMHVISRFSAPGLLLIFLVGTLAAYDWLMSVQPAWFSTIFGLYYLSGGALSFIAVTTLICLGFRRAGILKETITTEHYHDLGKWMFCCTAFYTYIAFAQYLLIWYANLPEETIFYRVRAQGGWLYLSLALPFIRFFIPFFILLCRPAKRSLATLGLIAAWSLIAEFIDLFWVTMPVHYAEGPALHWLDFATLAAVFSICGLQFWGRFRRNKMVPVGNLRFEQGLHFENA
jgi:hypothetical protein